MCEYVHGGAGEERGDGRDLQSRQDEADEDGDLACEAPHYDSSRPSWGEKQLVSGQLQANSGSERAPACHMVTSLARRTAMSD